MKRVIQTVVLMVIFALIGVGAGAIVAHATVDRNAVMVDSMELAGI